MTRIAQVHGIVRRGLAAAVLLSAAVAASWTGTGHAAPSTSQQLFSFTATFTSGPDRGKTLDATISDGAAKGQATEGIDHKNIADGAARGQAVDLTLTVNASQNPLVPAGTSAAVMLYMRKAGGTPVTHYMEIYSWSFGHSNAMTLALGDVNGDGIPDLAVQGTSTGGTTQGALAAALSGPQTGDQAALSICIGLQFGGRCYGVLVDPIGF